MRKRRAQAIALGLMLMLAVSGCGHGKPGFLSEGGPDLQSLAHVMSGSGMQATLE